MCAIGPEFYEFIKKLDENDGKLPSSLSPRFNRPVFEYNNSTCHLCNGYYGPSFGEPVCVTCHAFLYPDIPQLVPSSYTFSDKTDDGDSGNDEPSEMLYNDRRFLKPIHIGILNWSFFHGLQNSLDSETSPEDEASGASNSGPSGSNAAPSINSPAFLINASIFGPNGINYVSSGSNFGPSGNNAIPSSSNFSPNSTNPIPSSSNFGPSGNKPIPSSSNFGPSGNKPIPSSSNFGPSGSNTATSINSPAFLINGSIFGPNGINYVSRGSNFGPNGTNPIPSSSNFGISGNNPIPSSSKFGLSANNPIPSSSNFGSSGNNPIPSSSNFDSSGNNPIPSSSNFGSSGNNPLPSSSNFGSSGNNSIPSSSNFGSSGNNSIPSSSNFGSSGNNSIPSSSNFGLSGNNPIPSSSNFGPSGSGNNGGGSNGAGPVSDDVLDPPAIDNNEPELLPPTLARSLAALSTPRLPDNLAPGLVEQLPSEVLLCIFSYMDDLSLCACALVCARWWQLVRARVSPLRWRAFVARRWPLFQPLVKILDWHRKYQSLVESCFCRYCVVQMCAQWQPPYEENAWRRNRLRNELKMLRNDPPEGCAATPLDPKCCHWQAMVTGPAGSPYEGGIFYLYIQVPYSYPMSPPVVRFLTRILHPNVSRHGDLGIDSVHHNWSLALTISKVLISIQSLLTDPYTAVCMEPEVGDMYVNDRARFEKLARRWTWRYAMHHVLVSN